MQKPVRLARMRVAALTAAVLWISGCAPSVSDTPTTENAGSAETIVVGGKNFTEQLLIAEMTRRLLAANQFTVVLRDGMGSDVLRAAQENGQIDIYWEYTGTGLITHNGFTDKLPADEVYRKVKELDAERGLVWLEPSRANNTYALAMNRAEAGALGIATLTDLAREVNARTGDGDQRLTLASNVEFYAREDGLKPLQEAYGFEFRRQDIMRMVGGLAYQALRDHYVDVAVVFATDGRVRAFDFMVLADDKGFFPAYALTPVVRQEVLDANPDIADLLNALSAALDDETMAALNASVDVERGRIDDVARAFVEESGLIE